MLFSVFSDFYRSVPHKFHTAYRRKNGCPKCPPFKSFERLERDFGKRKREGKRDFAKAGIYKYRKGMGKTRGFQKSENGKILGFRKSDTGNFLGIKLSSPARPQEVQNGRKPGFRINKNHSLFSEKRQKNGILHRRKRESMCGWADKLSVTRQKRQGKQPAVQGNGKALTTPYGAVYTDKATASPNGEDYDCISRKTPNGERMKTL